MSKILEGLGAFLRGAFTALTTIAAVMLALLSAGIIAHTAARVFMAGWHLAA